MDNKKISSTASNAILLNDADNIVIAINNMKANQYLKDFEITLDAPIPSNWMVSKPLYWMFQYQ